MVEFIKTIVQLIKKDMKGDKLFVWRYLAYSARNYYFNNKKVIEEQHNQEVFSEKGTEKQEDYFLKNWCSDVEN